DLEEIVARAPRSSLARQVVVRVSAATRGADGAFPRTQRPAVLVVGVVRNGGGLGFDGLQVSDVLVGGGRPRRDAGLGPHSLVVDETVRVAVLRDAVYLAVHR